MTAGGPESGTTVPFGSDDVDPAEKPSLVGEVFTRVADRYDLMNDLMSAGVHRLWKRSMVAALDLKAHAQVLDLAGGTGDIAFRTLARWPAPSVAVCDINAAMLEEGRTRAWNRGLIHGLTWTCGDAEALPFDDGQFDACTMAFGLRNVTHIERALDEIRRVLRPGGRFLCLEFSPRVTPGLEGLYDAFSYRLIPAIGQAVTGDRAAYDYLVESIRRFPDPDRLAEMIGDAGFAGIRIHPYSGGIAVLHAAWRI